MAEPIKVDFKRGRNRSPTPGGAKKPPPPGRPPPGPGHEPMINWRAVPRVALVVLAVVAVMAAWKWFTSR